MRCGCALRSSSAAAADEVLLVVERHREADAGLERVDLVVELVAREDQPGLDAQHVERLEPERLEPVRLARGPDRVPHRGPVGRMAEDLVAELAGVAGARDHDRDAVVAADPADQEAEPLELVERRLSRRRPDRARASGSRLFGPCTARLWSWSVESLQFTPQAEALHLLAQPDAVVFVAADEAEVVLGRGGRRWRRRSCRRSRCRGRVDHLADRQLADVAGHHLLDERLGVRAEHLPLAQRREVDDGQPSRGRPSTRRSPPSLLKQCGSQ